MGAESVVENLCPSVSLQARRCQPQQGPLPTLQNSFEGKSHWSTLGRDQSPIDEKHRASTADIFRQIDTVIATRGHRVDSLCLKPTIPVLDSNRPGSQYLVAYQDTGFIGISRILAHISCPTHAQGTASESHRKRHRTQGKAPSWSTDYLVIQPYFLRKDKKTHEKKIAKSNTVTCLRATTQFIQLFERLPPTARVR